ncbi:hypothetical protein D3C73_1319180 [compost metagenome]
MPIRPPTSVKRLFSRNEPFGFGRASRNERSVDEMNGLVEGTRKPVLGTLPAAGVAASSCWASYWVNSRFE